MKKVLAIIAIAILLTSCATSSDMKCAFGVYCNVESKEKLEKIN